MASERYAMSIVFVTAYTDHDTVERIHQQGQAPVIARPLYRERLADAVAAVTQALIRAYFGTKRKLATSRDTSAIRHKADLRKLSRFP